MKNDLDIIWLTADNLCNIIKIIIFALDDLYENDSKFEISNEQLSDVYYKFNKMYLSSHLDSILEIMCKEL